MTPKKRAANLSVAQRRLALLHLHQAEMAIMRAQDALRDMKTGPLVLEERVVAVLSEAAEAEKAVLGLAP